jgi:integrase
VVYKVTKLAAARIGDASEIGAHSLRAGFVSEAVHAGVNEFRIAEHTGHRSLANLRRYWRFMPRRDGFRNHPCAAIGF